MDSKRVLLTGVTGFLGSHTAIQLLNKGYKVIGTLRSKKRINEIRDVIAKHTDHIENLTFAEADLSDEDRWYELTSQVDYVQHVASPFPRESPKHEDELIIPAKNGTLTIMKAALKNNVKRVVITSSLAAIAYGKTPKELRKVFTESDWSDVTRNEDITPYYKSKTIAEKAAWDFIQENRTDHDLELTTVNPGVMLGPVIDQDFGTSANMIIMLMNGSFPALPKIEFDIVDVRSVADLLIRAMEAPQAAGNRYIATAQHLTLKEIAQLLKRHYPERKIPTAQLPNVITKMLSYVQPVLKPTLLEVVERKIDASKARKELGWQPIPAEEAVLACAESIVANKLVK
ncbi:aldehyde reductase [Fibrisoma montanum]|uniref:Aldehyde reductase n=1 Tax=Fibrisoma montanum TaxID=2305895 RepID=A0A418LZW1_9BACT|nr:aldehyde reductase [Fibrisoma montanum]RIV18789.1 aldehyde reductase [Fibrisoma montanum]